MKIILILLLGFLILSINEVWAQCNIESEYQVESGKIIYQFGDDFSGKEIYYFNQFGVNESHLTSFKPKQKGKLTKIKTIIKGDSIIEIDLLTNNIKYRNIDENSGLLNKSDKILTAGGFKKSGVRIIEGKKCNEYLGDVGKICIWNGIILYLEIDISGKRLSKKALLVDTLSVVSNSVFSVNYQ